MSVYQTYLPYDESTFTNAKTIGQGVEAGMAAIGLVKVLDPGSVIWANASAVPQQNNLVYPRVLTQRYQGAWAGGTSYTGQSTGNGINDWVTNGGVTFLCIANTQKTMANTIQNTVTSTVATAVSATSGGNTVYTVAITGGTANGLIGYQFVVTGDLNAQNNGTFCCVASTATNVTLSNPNGVAHAAGGSTYPTLASVATVLGYFATTTDATYGSNALVGYSLIASGFTSGSNNTTFTATSSGNSGSTAVVCGTISGATASAQTGVITMNVAPASDLVSTVGGNQTGHWVPYYFDIWRTNDLQNPTKALSAVATVGTVTTYTGTGLNYVVGEAVTIAGFSHAVNNGTFVVQTVTGTTSFTVNTVSQAAGTNETTAATVYNCDNPLYVRFVYFNTGSSTPAPCFNIIMGTLMGTGVSSATPTGNLFNNGGSPPEFVTNTSNPSNTTVPYECDFQSSDNGSFSVMMFRDPTGAGASARAWVLFADRARDINGNTLDTFWQIGAIGTGLSTPGLSQTLFKNGVGATMPASAAMRCLPSINCGGQSTIANGLGAARPIFPLPGYVANPCLQAITMFSSDCSEGELVNVIMYNATHTYLITKNNGTAIVSGSGTGFVDAIGIRWE